MAGNLSLTREYNRIFTIMRDEFEPILWDNVTTRTSLLFRMKEMGAIQNMGGREHLRFNIVKELPDTSAYTDLDTLTPSRADPATSAVYEWKQLSTPIQMSGLDMIKTGQNAEPQLLKMFIEASELSMRDGIGGNSIGIYSDAGESDLTKISGLQNMLTTSTTTGTVGQLSRATTTAWRHVAVDVSNDFSVNGLIQLRSLYRQTGRFDETVDSIVVTGSTMDNYERDLTSTFQVNLPLSGPPEQKMIDAGFANVRYKNALVFNDDGVPANKGYALNLAKSVRLIVREGRNAEIGDFVKSRDKDDLVAYILWAGNLITTQLRNNGLLENADTY